MVAAQAVDLSQRVATLSEEGLLLLQQRYVHCLTRVVISLPRFERQSAAVLAEAELLEEWNEALASARVADGSTLVDAVDAEAVDFDGFMGSPEQGGKTRRHLLGTAGGRPRIRREVRAEIDRRLAAAPV